MATGLGDKEPVSEPKSNVPALGKTTSSGTIPTNNVSSKVAFFEMFARTGKSIKVDKDVFMPSSGMTKIVRQRTPINEIIREMERLSKVTEDEPSVCKNTSVAKQEPTPNSVMEHRPNARERISSPLEEVAQNIAKRDKNTSYIEQNQNETKLISGTQPLPPVPQVHDGQLCAAGQREQINHDHHQGVLKVDVPAKFHSRQCTPFTQFIDICHYLPQNIKACLLKVERVQVISFGVSEGVNDTMSTSRQNIPDTIGLEKGRVVSLDIYGGINEKTAFNTKIVYNSCKELQPWKSKGATRPDKSQLCYMDGFDQIHQLQPKLCGQANQHVKVFPVVYAGTYSLHPGGGAGPAGEAANNGAEPQQPVLQADGGVLGPAVGINIAALQQAAPADDGVLGQADEPQQPAQNDVGVLAVGVCEPVAPQYIYMPPAGDGVTQPAQADVGQLAIG